MKETGAKLESEIDHFKWDTYGVTFSIKCKILTDKS